MLALATKLLGLTWQEALGWMLIPLVGMFIIMWLAWVFGWGRFKPTSQASNDASKLRFVTANFVAKIVDEFRHLLALVIVSVFAIAMFFAMWPGLARDDIEGMIAGLQAVAASLGGLLGSIIGYYFGESAGKARDDAAGSSLGTTSSIEQGPAPGAGIEADELVALSADAPAGDPSGMQMVAPPRALTNQDPP